MLTLVYCGSCGIADLNIRNEQATCNVCGTTQGRFKEMIIKDNDIQFMIELDTIFDEPTSGMFTMPGMVEFMQNHNIKFELVTWNGPGGGWPIIRFTGLRKNLKELCTTFYADAGLASFIEEDWRQ